MPCSRPSRRVFGLVIASSLCSLAACPEEALIQILYRAYPDTFVQRQEDSLLLNNGTRLWLDQDFSDYAHSLAVQPYPGGWPVQTPPDSIDFGRDRWYALLYALYGDSQQAVASQLEAVTWLADEQAQSVSLHSAQAVARRFARASQAIVADPRWRTEISQLWPMYEPFEWRQIAGSTLVSAHSFGIAFDLNPWQHSYWRWDIDQGQPMKWRSTLPDWVVHIFEREGFVWGGRWHHYDTMHFEYRPEVILLGGGSLLPPPHP